ncbi:MAG: hypothetical protein OKBPIBMD_01625 [Chlorobi bacterium]|nr:hypothetical protein [Chlorobiota bacterium]
MVIRFLWIVLVCCGTAYMVTAQGAADSASGLQYYTTTTVSDRIAIPRVLRQRGGLVVHVNTESCSVCMLNVRTVLNLAGDNSLPTVVYARTSSYTQYEEIKSQFPDAEVIYDELGAYAQLHHVTNYPVIMVADKYGSVRYVGVPGGTNTFDIQSCRISIVSLATEKDPSEPFVLPEVTPIVDISQTIGRRMSVFSSLKHAPDGGSIVMLDRVGSTLSSISVQTGTKLLWLKHLDSATNIPTLHRPMLVAVSNSADSVLIADQDLMTSRCFGYWYTPGTGKANVIDLPEGSRSRTMLSMGWDDSTKTLWVSRRPAYWQSDPDTVQTSILCVANDGTPSYHGGFTDGVLASYCPGFYWSAVTETPHYMIELQSLSKTINVYDRSSKNYTTVHLEYPQRHSINALERIKHITRNSSVEAVKEAADSIQVLNRVIGSRTEDEILVYSRTTTNHYPELSQKWSGKYVHYVTRHKVPSGKCTGFWFLPDGIIPQDYDGNILYCTDFEVKEQKIVTISLE